MTRTSVEGRILYLSVCTAVTSDGVSINLPNNIALEQQLRHGPNINVINLADLRKLQG